MNLYAYVQDMNTRAEDLSAKFELAKQQQSLPPIELEHLGQAVEGVAHAALSMAYHLLLLTLQQNEKVDLPVDYKYTVEDNEGLGASIELPCREDFWGTSSIIVIRTSEKDMDEDSDRNMPWFGVTGHGNSNWTELDLLRVVMPAFLGTVPVDMVIDPQ